MVFTRSQRENLSRDKLVEELLKLLDVSSKFSDLTEKFNDFVSKYDKVYAELQISRNCNFHLLQKIVRPGRNPATNSQYHRRGLIELNPVPKSLEEEIMEENVCKREWVSLKLVLLQKSSIMLSLGKTKPCHCQSQVSQAKTKRCF